MDSWGSVLVIAFVIFSRHLYNHHPPQLVNKKAANLDCWHQELISTAKERPTVHHSAQRHIQST